MGVSGLFAQNVKFLWAISAGCELWVGSNNHLILLTHVNGICYQYLEYTKLLKYKRCQFTEIVNTVGIIPFLVV